MQFTVNLIAGEKRRMEVQGLQFLIVSATVATPVAVALRWRGEELESVTTAGRGFRARVDKPGFDAVELTAVANTQLEIIVTASTVEFDFVTGAQVVATIANLPLAVANDRGSPGNLMFVSGVSLADAPATAVINGAAVACGPAAVVVSAANAARRALRFLNLGPDPVALGPAGLTWATRTIVVEVGDVWVEDRAANLAWSAITDAGKAASVTAQAITA